MEVLDTRKEKRGCFSMNTRRDGLIEVIGYYEIIPTKSSWLLSYEGLSDDISKFKMKSYFMNQIKSSDRDRCY